GAVRRGTARYGAVRRGTARRAWYGSLGVRGAEPCAGRAAGRRLRGRPLARHGKQLERLKGSPECGCPGRHGARGGGGPGRAGRRGVAWGAVRSRGVASKWGG